MIKRLVQRIWNAAAAVMLAGLVCMVVLAMAVGAVALLGYPPIRVADLWLHGAAGSWYALSSSCADACPLLLTGLAAGVAFRAGVLNIGAQGQFLLGALVAVALTTRMMPFHQPALVIPTALLGGIFAGGLWGLVAQYLEQYRSVPVVLSTILLNFVALYLAAAALQGPLRAVGTAAAQSPEIAGKYWLPLFVPYTDFHIGIILALAVAVLLWVLQQRTTFGFESKVVGLNAGTAKAMNMPVVRRQFQIMFISSGCAGLGGAVQVLGQVHFMTPHMGNYGYAGIAVALLGQLNPLGIVLAAIFFGFLDTGAFRVEESSLALPHDMANVIKAVVILVMLVVAVNSLRRSHRIGKPKSDSAAETTSV
jgi:simple sugar transport system permease protein